MFLFPSSGDFAVCTAVPSWTCLQAVWHIPLLCVQWKTPDDGQRNCPKHVEFYSKNKLEKLVHLVGFIIRITNFIVINQSLLYIGLDRHNITTVPSSHTMPKVNNVPDKRHITYFGHLRLNRAPNPYQWLNIRIKHLTSQSHTRVVPGSS